MKQVLFAIFTVSVILFGCNNGDSDHIINPNKAKGPVQYGGVFRVNEVENFRNLFPLNLTDAASHRTVYNVYEGLVKFNTDLEVIPSLAERWVVNEDATSFTFYIRKGVKFHDDPCFPEGKGRELKASDFKYCLTRLCTFSSDNIMFSFVKGRIVGADEYYESTKAGHPIKEGVSGVKVIDDYTLQIDLQYSYADFINLLGHSCFWIFPEEAYKAYGIDMRIKGVGTGPFFVKSVKEGEAVILQRNPNYWKTDEYGNQLPYLDAIKITFLKEKKAELMEFRKGNLDMIFRLPLEMINDVTGELEDAKAGGNIPFKMQVKPGLSIQYYGFQHKSDLFKDKNIRLAFNYAIDRESLVNYTLQGDGRPANHGIVPEGFNNYEYDSLKGYSFDPELARSYMSKAGYPGGKGFPEITLQLNSGGAINTQVAEVVQKMLEENLNVKVKLEVMPMAQHYENLEIGKAVFWRAGWVADYPDPENFLNLLYGKHVPQNLSDRSYLNSVRYQSARFDSLFELAQRTIDEKERMKLYRMADQQAINDGAILPLYYEEWIRLLHLNVRNFPQNAIEHRDFTSVYFKEPEEDETGN